MSVVIETSVGDLTIDLLIEERPKCCYNFLKLCKMKYYNFCIFHRIEKDFIAQTGDPSGTGKGGQSIFAFLDGGSVKFFRKEMVPKVNHTRLGTVSMVNNGDDLHGSQFFFTLRENLDYLDGNHTVFGYVVEGLETLTKMNELFFSDIIITHSIILADPFDDPPDLIKQYPDSSPEPSDEIIAKICIAHNIDEKPEMDPKVQESKAAATILEMIGDLPSEDVKPPDNVLFVCKLNPVTKEEDLEVIFSRFGKITECEIIRDQKTGDSLQYAFIEFEEVEACEKAYFKMDNVLIDDRRIHVDFSQSVAKYKWHRKSASKRNQGAKSVTKERSPVTRSRDRRHEGNNSDHRRGHKHYSDDREISRRKEYSKDEHRRYERNRDRDRDREGEGESRRDDNRKRDRDTYYRDRKYEKDESSKRRDRSRSRDHHRDRDRSYRKDRDYCKDLRRDREKDRLKDRHNDRDRDRGKTNRR